MAIIKTNEHFRGILATLQATSPSYPPARSFAEWDALAGHPPRTDEVLEQAFRYATGVGAGILNGFKREERGHE